jgi:hypothetical protein
MDQQHDDLEYSSWCSQCGKVQRHVMGLCRECAPGSPRIPIVPMDDRTPVTPRTRKSA